MLGSIWRSWCGKSGKCSYASDRRKCR